MDKFLNSFSSCGVPANANLSIVIPTYNERRNVYQIVDRVEETLFSVCFELIIVDDNSPDNTSKVAEELNSVYGNLKF